MELNKFIEQSLVEIMTGIENAQGGLKDSSAEINPDVRSSDQHKLKFTTEMVVVEEIVFDIAVAISNEAGAGAKIGVLSGLFNLGTEGSFKDTNKSAHRIQFKIPVSFPRK